MIIIEFFLGTLSSEQMVIVFNLIGYMLLMSTLSSIVSLLIGDQLINSLNLVTKFPKLAKYIKFKQTLNKHSLRYNIVLFYILLILLMSVNIFMFFFLIFFIISSPSLNFKRPALISLHPLIFYLT